MDDYAPASLSPGLFSEVADGVSYVDIQQACTLLGVDADASPQEIKAAYRMMLKGWHPDRFAGDPERSLEAAEQTRRIIAAYDFLSAAPSVSLTSPGQSGPEPLEMPLWRQWNPFDPSHQHFGPNTVWDRVAIAGVIVVGLALLIVFGLRL